MNRREQVVGVMMAGLVPLSALLTLGTWFMFNRIGTAVPDRAAPTTTTTMLPRLARADAAASGGLDGLVSPVGADSDFLPAEPDRIPGSADNQVSGTVDSPPTTATPRRGDRRVSQVAWALAGKVSVSEAPPPGWATMRRIETWEQPEIPYSAAAHQGIAALPREGYSIAGRVKTPAGWEFDSKSPFGSRFTMLVTERRGYWAEVLIPVRPNGTRGYVDTRKLLVTRQDHIVEVDLSDRRLVAWHGTRKIIETPVTIGSASRSTPTGRFYVTDRRNSTPGPSYGSHILALNGYSEKLDYFDDGVPVIALHGTDRPDLIGQAASNGCVRMPNEVVRILYDQLPVGTMVEIRA